MKYFSLDSWDILYSDNKNATEYETYLSRFRMLLPKNMQSLTDRNSDISLNDSTVQSIETLTQEQKVEIFLNGRWIKETVVGPRIFRLEYKGVTRVTSAVASNLHGLFDGGYGVHGFDEVEVLAAGLFEHRMLFSSGIEISVQFSDFVLDYKDPHPVNLRDDLLNTDTFS